MKMATSEHGTCSHKRESDVVNQKPDAYTLSYCNLKVSIVLVR